MARVSVWYVRAALVHFVLGTTAGAWALVSKSELWAQLAVSVRPVHVEVLLVGWLCQLAVGVAIWIFPFSGQVSDDRCVWAAWGLLNAGLLGVVAGTGGDLRALTAGGRLGEVVAAGLLIWALWPRLRPLPGR